MDLPAFIRSIGVDQAAELFDETPRTVESWMYGERTPRPATARKIVERTRGAVPFEGCYAARAASDPASGQEAAA